MSEMNERARRMFEKRIVVPGTFTKAGVGVIIQDRAGRILLEKRKDCGMWGLPGGKIEPGETIEQAAMRESKEETGLDTQITALIGVYSDPGTRIVTYLDNGDVAHLIDIILAAKITGGSLSVSEESEDLQFFLTSNLPDDLIPPVVMPLADYIAGKTCLIK